MGSSSATTGSCISGLQLALFAVCQSLSAACRRELTAWLDKVIRASQAKNGYVPPPTEEPPEAPKAAARSAAKSEPHAAKPAPAGVRAQATPAVAVRTPQQLPAAAAAPATAAPGRSMQSAPAVVEGQPAPVVRHLSSTLANNPLFYIPNFVRMIPGSCASSAVSGMSE